MKDIFPILILNSLPGAGKSEITEFLRQYPSDQRRARFHIGEIHALDDFPMLWTWFEEDEILENMLNRPRLHTTSQHDFLHNDLWHLLIQRLNLEYEKLKRDRAGTYTIIIEFARGSEHGGYQAAYDQLSETILREAVTMYVWVTFEEALRKNRLRSNPERPYSILEHSLSDEKMNRLYGEDDWKVFSRNGASHLMVKGIKIPTVIFENEDDVTTVGGEVLAQRLEKRLNTLWGIRETLRTGDEE
jgi:hypothetical protein